MILNGAREFIAKLSVMSGAAAESWKSRSVVHLFIRNARNENKCRLSS